jgi:transcription antitermination factor NusG
MLHPLGDPSDLPPRWLVMIAEPSREDTARRGLEARQFRPYLPIIYRRIPAGRAKTREVSRAMFTCYFFLPDSGMELMDQIRAVPGVYDFMSLNGVPATLSNAAILAIRAQEERLEAKRQANLANTGGGYAFEVGQNVTVAVGPFDRLAGTISQVSAHNVEVLLEMEILGRNTVSVAPGRVMTMEGLR